MRSFEWFERTFPDDIGEPIHCLCWTLALYRSGQLTKTAHILRQTMLLNLYLIPHLLGGEQDKLDIWHGTNYAEKDYLQYVSPQVFALWDEDALRWARETYASRAFRQVRERHIEILAVEG